MFRRFANRVNDAVSNAASSLSNNTSDDQVSELAAMGLPESEARRAIQVANGDMTRATEWLLSHGSPTGTVSNPINIPDESSTAQEDKDLQRAIQASLQPKPRKPKTQQSAASKHAGRAAAARNTNSTVSKQSLLETHPKVQMPKRLSQHDQIDVIMRCANRVAPYSLAVDTLLRSLKTIQADPSNRKYHTVDTTTPMFQRSLNAPGVLDFLKAVNFHPNYNNKNTLTLAHFDPAAFYLGITSLEQLQETSHDYKRDKIMRLFQKELAVALSETNVSEEENSRRKEYLSKLPSEPTNGGSKITVEYGVLTNHKIAIDSHSDNHRLPAQSLTKVTRGFDHDDTLGDVLNWLGGQSSIILANLEAGDWRLVDRNRQGADEDYGFHHLGLDDMRERTLQYVGCWPTGRLAIVPKLNL